MCSLALMLISKAGMRCTGRLHEKPCPAEVFTPLIFAFALPLAIERFKRLPSESESHLNPGRNYYFFFSFLFATCNDLATKYPSRFYCTICGREVCWQQGEKGGEAGGVYVCVWGGAGGVYYADCCWAIYRAKDSNAIKHWARAHFVAFPRANGEEGKNCLKWR